MNDFGEPLLVQAHDILTLETEGIAAIRDRLLSFFVEAVNLPAARKGSIIGIGIGIGIGKSGPIARKTVATLSSTGTPAGNDALHKYGRESDLHFIHDRGRNTFQAFGASRPQIQDAGLVATRDAGCAHARVIKRNSETGCPGEASAAGIRCNSRGIFR
jgi:hypothetical protein